MSRDPAAPKSVAHARALTLRDRNHPAVIRWSQVNEPSFNPNDSQQFEQDLYAAMNGNDGTRPISIDAAPGADSPSRYPAVPSYARNATVTRNVTVFNDDLTDTAVDFTWTARLDNPTGTVVASGSTSLTIPLGSRVTQPVSFTTPATGSRVYLQLSTAKSGSTIFRTVMPMLFLLTMITLGELWVRRGNWECWASAGAFVALQAVLAAPAFDLLLSVSSIVLTTLPPVGLGVYVRSVLRRATEAERHRERSVREARTAERTAIARELHDLVAHHMASIA